MKFGIKTLPLCFSAELEKSNGAENLTKEQAKEIVTRCIRVSYLRDCRATNKFHIACVDAKGAEVEGPVMIDANWEIARGIKGYE